jgi:hypothetical protein
MVVYTTAFLFRVRSRLLHRAGGDAGRQRREHVAAAK